MGTMLELNQAADHYNEIVVDATAWAAGMPYAIEAVVGDRARYDAFVDAYGLERDQVAYARLDLHDFDAPFK